MTDDPRVTRILLTLRERVALATEEAGLEILRLGYGVDELPPLHPIGPLATGSPRSGSTASAAVEEPRAGS